MRFLRISAFAKINLCLDILGRRADGYHELRTVFQTISLHDTLELSLTRNPGIVLECDDPSLPLGRENLVWRALDVLRRALRLRSGVHAMLHKQIPAGRGLGGGSSDAAAALIGLLRLTGRRLPAPRLLEIAAGLGADVPFFLCGGRALGVGRGDEIYPLPDLPRRAVLVVSPASIAVPTRDAYAWVSSTLTERRPASKIWCFCALCWSPQWNALSNGFEKAVFARHPRLGTIKRKLLQGGAAEAALAGSGSAVFGVFPDPAQARRTARSFSDDRAFVVRTLSRKEYLRALGWPGVF
ncbi:MAG: 4-(cytidine 5'-diphospho)-2-C-methyl-D-erythritol kinase [Acidobacteria bacterium]|nr:4-(cytidine 5'-diphospho)-2-C-methyl-D-erythritol kinase [Acidobacteriota bacterium]MBI3663083.1 4-(cytidine 5'-diphospho)-2-C-methyl-D-erythritol kinase [Acidobacteriota bacterium]